MKCSLLSFAAVSALWAPATAFRRSSPYRAALSGNAGDESLRRLQWGFPERGPPEGPLSFEGDDSLLQLESEPQQAEEDPGYKEEIGEPDEEQTDSVEDPYDSNSTQTEEGGEGESSAETAAPPTQATPTGEGTPQGVQNAAGAATTQPNQAGLEAGTTEETPEESPEGEETAETQQESVGQTAEIPEEPPEETAQTPEGTEGVGAPAAGGAEAEAPLGNNEQGAGAPAQQAHGSVAGLEGQTPAKVPQALPGPTTPESKLTSEAPGTPKTQAPTPLLPSGAAGGAHPQLQKQYPTPPAGATAGQQGLPVAKALTDAQGLQGPESLKGPQLRPPEGQAGIEVEPAAPVGAPQMARWTRQFLSVGRSTMSLLGNADILSIFKKRSQNTRPSHTIIHNLVRQFGALRRHVQDTRTQQHQQTKVEKEESLVSLEETNPQ